MFTGIVSHQNTLLSRQGGIFVLQKSDTDVLTLGQSIAHDGACMSVTEIYDDTYTFFAMEESLQKTTLGEKKSGDTINIEYCVRVGDRLDGHLVTGHIDTRGTVYAIDSHSDRSRKITVSYPQSFSLLIVSKGSIAMNGVSLTVVDDMAHPHDTTQSLFSVWLIPLTLSCTNLGSLAVGSMVNLEFDMLAKYAQKR